MAARVHFTLLGDTGTGIDLQTDGLGATLEQVYDTGDTSPLYLSNDRVSINEAGNLSALFQMTDTGLLHLSSYQLRKRIYRRPVKRATRRGARLENNRRKYRPCAERVRGVVTRYSQHTSR